MSNESIVPEIKKALIFLFRVMRNMLRVRLLLEEAQTLEIEITKDDIFRMCIVFIHATLEDFLREFARIRLAKVPIEVLNEIPLAGVSLINRPQKFLLGELKKHSEKSINDLIQESIDEYLGRLSFSSCDDIASMLKGKLNIDLTNLQCYFADIDQLIQRRHFIVHNADLNKKGVYNSINLSETMKWFAATSNFILDLTPLIVDTADAQNYIREIIEESKTENGTLAEALNIITEVLFDTDKSKS